MSRLIESYTELLKGARLKVRPDGSVVNAKDNVHFIKGKPLVLPLESVLKSEDINDKIVFHPLAESASKGESDVLSDLRQRLTYNVNLSTSQLIAFFLQLAVGEIKYPLDPQQMKVMKLLKGVETKVHKDILQFMTATTRGEGKKTPLVKVYLSRKPTKIDGVTYSRTGVVTFPLYSLVCEELSTKTKGFSVLGVSTNKSALETFKKVFEYIFPGLDKNPEAYNIASANTIAPYADALIRTILNLCSTINEQVRLFKDVDPIVQSIELKEEWACIVDDIDALFPEIQRIPLQPNADGKSRLSDVRNDELATRIESPQPEIAPQAQPQVQVRQQAQQTPVQQAPTQAPSAQEPEFIITPEGKRAPNPKFLRPVTPGVGFGMGNPNVIDPYLAPAAVPSRMVNLSQEQMYTTVPGGMVQPQTQMPQQVVPYGGMSSPMYPTSGQPAMYPGAPAGYPYPQQAYGQPAMGHPGYGQAQPMMGVPPGSYMPGMRY